MTCPLCRRPTPVRVLRLSAHDVARCLVCGLAYLADPPEPGGTRACYEDLYVDTAASARIDAGRRRLFVDFLRRVPPFGGRRLLDVGCGSGRFMELAREWGWEVHGVEIASPAVAAAQRRGLDVHLGVPRAREAMPVPFEDGAFDVVTLWNVAEFFEAPLQQFRELHRVLAAGGVLFMRTQNEAFHVTGFRLRHRFGGWPLVGRALQRASVFHPLLWGQRSLRTVLDAAGFTDVRIWNSPLTPGDPYGTIRAESLVRVAKALVAAVARSAAAVSGDRLLLASSLAAMARRAA